MLPTAQGVIGCPWVRTQIWDPRKFVTLTEQMGDVPGWDDGAGTGDLFLQLEAIRCIHYEPSGSQMRFNVRRLRPFCQPFIPTLQQ